MPVNQLSRYSQVAVSAKKIQCGMGKGEGEGVPRPDLIGVLSEGSS